MTARAILLAICICILIAGVAAVDITVSNGVSLSNTLDNKSTVLKEVVTDLKSAPVTLAIKADGKASYKEVTEFDILSWKTYSTKPVATALKDIPYENRAKYKAEYIARYGNLVGTHKVQIDKDVIELDILDVAYLPEPGVLQLNVSPKVNGKEKALHNPLKIANPPVLVQGEPDVTVKDDLILGGRAEDPAAATLESVAYTVMTLPDGKPTFGEPDPTVTVYSAGNFTATILNTNPSRHSAAETFLQLIVGAGTTSVTNGNLSAVRVYNQSATVFMNTRNTMEFLTDGLLPAGGLITNASLNVYGSGKYDLYSAAPSLSFTNYTPGNYIVPQHLVDYNRNGTEASRFGNDIPYASYSTTGYNTQYFSSTGISQINNTGYTAVMGRLSNDTDSIAIPRGTSALYSGYYYHLTYESGTAKDPYITYTYLRAAVANFTGSPREGSAGLLVQFTDTSENATPITTWNWSFGDGDYSSEQNPQHVYTMYGGYDVNLSITTSGGYSDYELKSDYIIISSEDQSNNYAPQATRFTVFMPGGYRAPNALVTASMIETSLPDGVTYLNQIYGIDEDIAEAMLTAGATQTAHTGTDGSAVFNVHPCLKYYINVTSNTGETVNVSTYPIETDYNIWLPDTMDSVFENLNATLTFSEPNASYFTLGVNYEDLSAATSTLLFYVNASNGTPIYQTSVAPGTANNTLNTTILNVRGESYYWGIRAARNPVEENISLDRGVTAKGANGVLIDLGLPTTPINWYMWISLLLLFLITSLASKVNIRFIAILMPLMAALFWWFGWMTGDYLASMIPFCCALGVIYYMKGSLRENYGVGGPGSMVTNIIVFLVILQMMVGFINGTGIFHETALTPDDAFSNVGLTDIQDGLDDFAGINDPLQSAASFASLSWTVVRASLTMFASVLFVSVFLGEMFPYIPVEFLAIIQAGIYLIYIFAIMKWIGKSGTESDF